MTKHTSVFSTSNVRKVREFSRLDLVPWLCGITFLLSLTSAYAATTWKVEQNTARMTNITTISAFVDSVDIVKVDMFGASREAIKPRLWVFCANDEVRLGFNYGFSPGFGASAQVMWKIGNRAPVEERNWYVTSSQALVSPERNETGLLVLLDDLNSTLAFQLTYVGNFRNSLKNSEATYASFSLAGASHAIQQVRQVCAANKPIPAGANQLAERLNQGLQVAAKIKIAVAEYHQIHGRFPNSDRELGVEKASMRTTQEGGHSYESIAVSVQRGGQISIAYNRGLLEIKKLLRWSFLNMTPSVVGGSVVWSCVATKPLSDYQEWLPQTCGGTESNVSSTRFDSASETSTAIDRMPEPTHSPADSVPRPSAAQVTAPRQETRIRESNTSSTSRSRSANPSANAAPVSGDTGEQAARPVLLTKVAPVYPARALSRGLEGYVDIQFTIQPDGTTASPVVVFSTSSLFERSAIRAILETRYERTGRTSVNVRERVIFAIPQ